MLRRYDRRLKTLFSALSVVFQSDYPGEVRRELQSKRGREGQTKGKLKFSERVILIDVLTYNFLYNFQKNLFIQFIHISFENK